MERIYNVSDNRTKRVQLKFVIGVDSEGDFSYTDPFDLLNSDVQLLQKRCENHIMNYYKGFVIEESCFKEDEYDSNGIGEIEFHALKYYLQGIDLGKSFSFAGHEFNKSLPVEMMEGPDELNKKLATIVYDVQQKSSPEEIANMYKEVPVTYKKKI